MLYSHRYKWMMMAATKEEMWSFNNTMPLPILPSLWQLQIMVMIFYVIKICFSLCKMVTWLLYRKVRWLLDRIVRWLLDSTNYSLLWSLFSILDRANYSMLWPNCTSECGLPLDMYAPNDMYEWQCKNEHSDLVMSFVIC